VKSQRSKRLLASVYLSGNLTFDQRFQLTINKTTFQI